MLIELRQIMSSGSGHQHLARQIPHPQQIPHTSAQPQSPHIGTSTSNHDYLLDTNSASDPFEHLTSDDINAVADNQSIDNPVAA